MNITGIQFAIELSIILYRISNNKLYFGYPTTVTNNRVLFKYITIYNLETQDIISKKSYFTSITKWRFSSPINLKILCT